MGIFSAATWIYATHNRRLVDPNLSDQTIRKIRRASYAEPTILLFAIGAAWLHPLGWTVTLVIGFPLIFLIQSLFQEPEQALQSDGENA